MTPDTAEDLTIQNVAEQQRLGTLRRVHCAPGFFVILARAVAAVGLSVAGVFGARLIDVAAAQAPLFIVVGTALGYLLCAPLRSGHTAFVYDDGLVYARRAGATGVRWDEVERLEVIDKWTPEAILRLPDYVLTGRNGVTIHISGFVSRSKVLGEDLLERFPASAPARRRWTQAVVFLLFAAVLTVLAIVTLLGLVHLIDLWIDR